MDVGQLYIKEEFVLKLRFKFSKEGPIRYIGHLDFMRYMQKAIVRAKIPATYSQGYHPHMNLSFALPLGVGVETLGDYFDLEVREGESLLHTYLDALNDSLTEGVHILKVNEIPEEKKYNCMASIFYASYELKFKKELYSEEEISQAIKTFLAKESVVITKHSKKNTQEIDIKPHIYDLTYNDGVFKMLLPTGSHLNIKPELVIQTIFQNENLDRGILHIKRIDMYGEDRSPLNELRIN